MRDGTRTRNQRFMKYPLPTPPVDGGCACNLHAKFEGRGTSDCGTLGALSTELPEPKKLREGFEPPTTRVGGEVTVTYATGQIVCAAYAPLVEKHTGERGKKDGLGVSAPRCPSLQDYAPAPQSEQQPAEPSFSARPWLAEEVTLFFHHRC